MTDNNYCKAVCEDRYEAQSTPLDVTLACVLMMTLQYSVVHFRQRLQ